MKKISNYIRKVWPIRTFFTFNVDNNVVRIFVLIFLLIEYIFSLVSYKLNAYRFFCKKTQLMCSTWRSQVLPNILQTLKIRSDNKKGDKIDKSNKVRISHNNSITDKKVHRKLRHIKINRSKYFQVRKSSKSAILGVYLICLEIKAQDTTSYGD